VTSEPGATAAVRLPLDPGPPIDPYALAGPTGIVFQSADRILVGLGGALTLPLPYGLEASADVAEVTRVLASVECDDRFDPTTSGVMAFGALPFDRSEAAALVVPRIVYGAEASGQEWVTVVADDRADLPDGSAGLRSWLVRGSAAGPADSPGPGGRGGPHERSGPARLPSITPRTSDASFRAMVAESVRAVESGEVAKVVVARHVDVRMGDAIDVVALLRRWHRMEPTCSVFSMPTPHGHLVGASPELLVERSGLGVRSRPLAGTTDRAGESGSVLPRELLASTKDSAEHRMVVEAIGEALTPLCSELDVPTRPDLVHLHNITHLGTSVAGTLRRGPDGSAPTALALVAALHPTPAVGGVPRHQALDLISRLEPEARGYYAGAVGYVDGRGDGRWMIGIRAMTVNGADARLTAGVGVVAGSDPRTELAETSLKLTAAFDALAPGLPFTTTDHHRADEAVG
jgi:menaquinone-specific isochorismate synthase